MSLCFAAEKQLTSVFSVAEVMQDNFLWSKIHFSSYSISLSKKEVDQRLIHRNRWHICLLCLTFSIVKPLFFLSVAFLYCWGRNILPAWRNNWNRFFHVFHNGAYFFHGYGLWLAPHNRCHGQSLNNRYIVICMNFSITLQRISMLYINTIWFWFLYYFPN
jgi:hypothetical protein